MTNDRAVEILKAIIFMLGREYDTDEVEEAIHMAIEALEAQESCNDLATNLQPSKQDADDLISRAAAIDAIDVKNVNKGIISALQSIIEELPSAQPEQTKMIKEIRKWINSGNRGSADYFIVDKIEEIINKYE